MRRNPRVLAALWFAGAALLAVGPIYGVLTVRQGRPVAVVMLVVLPVLSGGLAGALFGERILRPGKGFLYAVLNGLATTCLALIVLGLLMGPTDGLLWVLVGEGMFGSGTGGIPPSSYPALAGAVVVFASLAMGPIIFPVGVLAGLGLHVLDRLFRVPGSSTPPSP